MLNKTTLIVIGFYLLSFVVGASDVRIKDITRFEGVRDNVLIGYGLVIGLAGTGDSPRNKTTMQSIKNALDNFGIIVSNQEVQSRNVAAVMLTANLPSFGQSGDKIDVTVSSIGDATSLTGGVLIRSALEGADNQIYALAQGVVSVGGYKFELNNNVAQKNHPTVGRVIRGATLEQSIDDRVIDETNSAYLILEKPDFTTASRIVEKLTQENPTLEVSAVHAGKIKIHSSLAPIGISTLAEIENTYISPAQMTRVVVNEKSGIIVSGTHVAISDVVISYGSLKLTIKTQYQVSQPFGIVTRQNPDIKTQLYANNDLKATESPEATYITKGTVTIANLVENLKKLNLTTRDIISILQALKKSGALHAELIIE